MDEPILDIVTATGHNDWDRDDLPSQPLLLVGREHDRDVVLGFLARPDIRLITLTGPGGVGKTALLLNIVTSIGDEIDIPCFSDVNGCTTDEAMRSITATFGVEPLPAHTLPTRLRDVIGEQRVLVLLDACEEMLAAGPLLGQVLARCPQLQILATSRQPFRIQCEQLYEVTPFTLPDAGHFDSLNDVAAHPAIALFVARVQSIQPAFELNEANRSTVVEICHRLDGLPLAIELAANQIRFLSLNGILRRLDDPVGVLTHGALDLPERHRSLQALLDSDYLHLRPDEQAFARLLATYPNDTPLSAVLATLGQHDRSTTIRTGELLRSLADVHLISLHDDSSGEWHISMRSTTRAYLRTQWQVNDAAAARPSVSNLVGALINSSDHIPASSSQLSRRERDVVERISHGLTNRQIAGELGIAERTIDSHVGNILRKLAVSSRAQIAAWAVRNNMTEHE